MNTRKLFFHLLAAILGGCVPVASLHPLYTDRDVVFEEKLLGAWADDSNSVWQFKRPDKSEKSYELLFSDNEGKKGRFAAHLVKLGSRFFLDVLPLALPCGDLNDPNKADWPYNAFFFVPARTFIKVGAVSTGHLTVGPLLKIWLTDDEDMKKLLADDPNAVKFESLQDGGIVLTASTKELQAFVLKYADDSRVFPREITLSRKNPEGIRSDPNLVLRF